MAPGMTEDSVHSGGTTMRTEEEVREQLSDLEASMKYALDNKHIWTSHDLRPEIKAIRWVLGEIEEL